MMKWCASGWLAKHMRESIRFQVERLVQQAGSTRFKANEVSHSHNIGFSTILAKHARILTEALLVQVVVAQDCEWPFFCAIVDGSVQVAFFLLSWS